MTGKELKEIQIKENLSIEKICIILDCASRTLYRYFSSDEIPSEKEEKILAFLKSGKGETAEEKKEAEIKRLCPFKKQMWKLRNGMTKEKFCGCTTDCMAYDKGKCKIMDNVEKEKLLRQQAKNKG